MSAFSEALREAIDAKGISVAELTRSCKKIGTPISTATLSYWLSGQTTPRRRSTFDVLRSIEHILELDPGELVRLVANFQEIGRVPPAEITVIPLCRELERLHDSWGLPQDDGLHRSQVISTYEIGKTQSKNVMRFVLEAERNGADRSTVAFNQHKDDIALEILHGATLGRTAHLHGHYMAFELLLPRPLERGELAVVELTHTNALNDDFRNCYELFVTHRTDLLALSLKFTTPTPPKSVTRSLMNLDSMGALITHRRDIKLKGSTAQATLADVNVGRLRIEWED